MSERVSRVLKWDVPIDDDWHEVGGGSVLHVDQQAAQYVGLEDRALSRIQVWTLEDTDSDLRCAAPKRVVGVFGTGHPVPEEATHLGSVLSLGGQLVWHVFEATS